MRKANILICDDDEGVCQSLEFILRDKYKLAFAHDGLEALDQIKHHITNLVLLDLKMPGMDGIGVLKELRKTKSHPKVIVVTGYSSVATAHRSFKNGASDYIPKPFDKNELLEAIERAFKE